MARTQQEIFRGVGTALVTPMRDGRVDEDALLRTVERQLLCGTDALIVAGTTGEAATLCDREQYALIRTVAGFVGKRIPVIAGAGSNDTSHAVELALCAAEAGADALLAVTPYYNKATPEGLIRHFTRIADATSLPVLLYNVPARTGVDLSPDVCRELSFHEKIVGIKEASGDVAHAARILSACDGRFSLYAGNDADTLPILSVGGSGVISVVSNLIPAEWRAIWRLAEAGQVRAAADNFLRFLPLCDALFRRVNPIPVKTALSLMGLCTEEMRLPLCPLGDADREVLRAVLEKYGLITEGENNS